ncbi:MurR/RpiR family transcriptional regulator [Microvirga sp. M2]|uniref:MurR/RpiR family transcriptional regulator n=1 Tax=Microvirga sp. M2 TaxID=3073270 RepID=UPI0039C23730
MLINNRSFTGSLTAANARIATFVVSHPEATSQLSIAELAQRVGVSEPTVIRFCRKMGYAGFREFRQDLVQNISQQGSPPEVPAITSYDTIEQAADKAFALTIRALEQVRKSLPLEAIRHAAVAILKARWVHVFGFGASATVAADAQHKLYRLAAMVVAHADPHMQAMAASTLSPEDVLIAISNSGAAAELIETVRLAQENNATIIAITRQHSPLADIASIVLPIEISESREIFTPMTVRIAQLTVIDALVVGVSLLSPPTVIQERFSRMDAAIRRRRIPTNASSPRDK